MFFENLDTICRRKNTTITAVLDALGRSSSIRAAWKKGSLPKIDIVMEMSEYLKVSVDELLYGDSIPNYNGETQRNEVSKLDPEWIEIISHIPDDRQQMCKDFLRTHMVIPAKYANSKKA